MMMVSLSCLSSMAFTVVVHMMLGGDLPFMTDEDINTIVTPIAPIVIHTGPITRARARQLNY